MSEPVQRFPTTQWSVVVAAQGPRTPDARRALERLFETYWYPVYAFIRARTSQPADAEDMTQGFFTSLLNRSSLEMIRPELGRFRAFLLASAKHYLSAERARTRAQKRGGGAMPLPLDFESADRRYRLEAPAEANPEVQFQRRWACAAFDAAEERLRREFAAAGKAVQFEAFRQYLHAGDEPVTYSEVAGDLEMSEAAVRTAVHRARKQFGRLLREQIAETIDPAAAGSAGWESVVEDEVGYLFRILGRQ